VWRHVILVVGRQDHALDEGAALAVAGDEGWAALVALDEMFQRVEAQPALSFLRAMARNAVIREDRLDVGGENRGFRSHGGCGGSRAEN